jgi:serine/threonine-protein kinase
MIAPGTRLGAYEIVGQLGAGGMGDVYRARDTKLNREVAIKILPTEFALDADRLARFTREAQVLAALNHPNIAQIYGFDDANDVHALVLELVEGPTLADRIAQGPIPLDEALPIAKQIAEALEAAHEQGIVHRDLKPANIKLRPDATVKVLDFGLAKLADPVAGVKSAGHATRSPTITSPAMMTRVGMILGTAAYMSPEQAKGKPADKRADIWAFGCVLYEMLTAARAFPGEDVTEILAAVVRAEPDWHALPTPTPPNVRHLLRRCLQKDPRLRLRDAGDAGIEIQDAIAYPAQASTTLAAEGKRAVPLRVASVLVILIAVIAATATWNLKPVPAAPRPVTRMVITLPPGDALAWDLPALAVSGDGSRLAYVAVRGGTRQIYLRALNSFDSTPLAGTERGYAPFFSPDGQWLGFFEDGRLKKVPVNGGPVLTLADAPAPHGATWSRSTIIFSPNGVGPAVQVSDAGGTPHPVTRMEKGDTGHYYPEFLPDGRAVLFGAFTAWDESRPVRVLIIDTGEQRSLSVNGGFPRYAQSGHLVYALGGTLMAAPFDLQRLDVTGAAVPVVENVQRSASSGAAQYAISSTGSLVYVRGAQAEQRRLVWVDRRGREDPLPAPVRAYEFAMLRLSPDGRRLAVGTDNQIWLYDLARETLTRLTVEGVGYVAPVWTPDSQRIAFTRLKDGVFNVYWQRADGSGGLERLTNRELSQFPQSFSPDGQLLAYMEVDPKGSDIWVLRMSDRKAQPFLTTPFIEAAPQFSPDGHWLAYISNESGRYEVYVQAYPGPGGKHQVSAEGGTEPMWSPKGGELFFRDGDRLMAVDITTQPMFSVGKPRMLFERHYMPTTGTIPYYTVTADGQRFVFVKDYEKSTPITQISVVENWFDELKRLVPAK